MSSVFISGLPNKPTLLQFCLVFPKGITKAEGYTDEDFQAVAVDVFRELSTIVKNPFARKLFKMQADFYNQPASVYGRFKRSMSVEAYNSEQEQVCTFGDSAMRAIVGSVTDFIGLSSGTFSLALIKGLRAWKYASGDQANKDLTQAWLQATKNYVDANEVSRSQVINETKLFISCTSSAITKGGCSSANELKDTTQGTIENIKLPDIPKPAVPVALILGAVVLAVLILD